MHTHTHLHLHSTCLHQRYLANISDASMRKLTQSGRALGDARWDHGDLTSNSGAFKQTTADMMMYDVNIVGIY